MAEPKKRRIPSVTSSGEVMDRTGKSVISAETENRNPTLAEKLSPSSGEASTPTAPQAAGGIVPKTEGRSALGVYDRLKQYFGSIFSHVGAGYRNLREWFLSLPPRKRWALLAGAAATLGVSWYALTAYLTDEEGIPERAIPRLRIDDDADLDDVRTPHIDQPRDDYFDQYLYTGFYPETRGVTVCCEHCKVQYRPGQDRDSNFIHVGDANVMLEVYVKPKAIAQASTSASKNSLFL